MQKNRPSRTAVLVSRGVAAVAAAPELSSLVPPRAAELTRAMLQRESLSSRLFVRLSRWGWFRGIVFGVSSVIASGALLHFALRKRHIEAQVRRALHEGMTQMVVLGAGLDTLAVRLAPEFPEVRFLEIDHPASQSSKRALLPPEAASAPNLHLCPLDLSLPDASFSDCPAFDPARPTVFIAEGLLMYLPVEAVRKLFSLLSSSVPDCRFVFTALTVGPKGRLGFERSSGLVDRWLALRQEPFQWGIRPEELPDFLTPLGFHLADHAEAERFRQESAAIVGDRPIAVGEHVYGAEAMRE